MSSMSSVAGLSKYLKTLPKTKYSIIGIIIISFIIGSVNYLIDFTANQNILEDFIYGGLYGLIVFGIGSIMGGALNQQMISVLNGINLKLKHSMFLSFLSMILLGIIILSGSIISHFINEDLFLNSMLFGCVLIYGFNNVIFSLDSISVKKSLPDPPL